MKTGPCLPAEALTEPNHESGNSLLGVAVFVVALCATSEPAAAQLGILEGFFKEISHVGVTQSCWNIATNLLVDREGCEVGTGFGVRVVRRFSSWYGGGEEYWKQGERKVEISGNGRDTTITYVENRATRPPIQKIYPFAHAELAIGYSQFSGFRSTATDVVLQGEFRELPSFGGLFQFGLGDNPFERGSPCASWFNPLEVSVEGGIHTGLIWASDVRAYTPALDPSGAVLPDVEEVFAATGSAFQIGLSWGFTAHAGKVSFSWERFRHWRELDLAWEGKAEAATIPESFPRSIDFGGWATVWSVRISLK